MSVLPVGFASASGVDVGDIGHSLRLRSAASAYLSRTITTDATSTYFAAVKRGKLGVVTPIFDTNIKFNANDTLTAFGLTTTAVFRDPTSWLFIHVSNGGLYVNGVSYGAVTTSSITNPRIGYDGTNYADMYVARIGVVGGTSSSYTNFGYQNTEINEWVSKTQSAVKTVVDAGGANSFMLDFDDATSLTTLGYDKSSKGNNWTLNNVSLTAGSTYDHMLDVPGNSYATLNPIAWPTDYCRLTDGNLNFAFGTASGATAIRNASITASGLWYYEVTLAAISGRDPCIGIAETGLLTVNTGDLGTISSEWAILCSGADNGKSYSNNTLGASLTTFATSDVVQVAYDTVAGKVWFGKNGTWLNSGNPSAGTGAVFSSGIAGKNITPTVSIQRSGNNAAINFGQRPFDYTPPTGFKALCQANLPDPAILNPELHFDVRTRTGTAAAYSVTDLLFPPDLAWIKSRGRAVDHALYDSVRGVQKQLESNQTGAETTETTGITAFNSNGYTGGALDQINGTTATNSFVDWLWKAGGAAVTNNNGSISSQVSANVLAGQSVVTYNGTGVNATVGHGLSSAPELIIHKNRNVAYDWPVWHKALLGTEYLMLNTTAAKATDTTLWNSSTPTTTTFPLGTDAKANYNQQVALCFHSVPGYSKVFSYTGNGSADGPFVHLGFKPKFVMLKNTTAAGNGWIIWDAVRDTYNIVGTYLQPNVSTAEGFQGYLDFTSNGFKLKIANADANGSGNTIVGIAVADVPAKYSLAR